MKWIFWIVYLLNIRSIAIKTFGEIFLENQVMMFVKFNSRLIVIVHFDSIYRLQFNQKSLKFYNIYKITLCVWKVIVYQRKIKYRRRRHGRGKTLKRSFFGTNSFLYPFDIQRIILHVKRSNLDDEKEVHECWKIFFRLSLWRRLVLT